MPKQPRRVHLSGAPLPRDEERFAKPSPDEGRAHMPPGAHTTIDELVQQSLDRMVETRRRYDGN